MTDHFDENAKEHLYEDDVDTMRKRYNELRQRYILEESISQKEDIQKIIYHAIFGE